MVLVVDPSVIQSLLSSNTTVEGVGIDQLARGGAPFELRVDVEVKVKSAYVLKQSLVTPFMEKLDQEPVDDSDGLRRYLVSKELQSTGTRRRMQLPVHAYLTLTPNEDADGPDSAFFDSLSKSSQTLAQYQVSRCSNWSVDKHFAPLKVACVYLRLGFVPLRSAILKSAAKLAAKGGVPVSCSEVTLDLRSLQCQNHHLESFFNSVMASTGFSILTASSRPGGPPPPDCHRQVDTMFRSIGPLAHQISLDLSGLFMVYRPRASRRAIMRGLIEFILPRTPIASLTCTDTTVFTEHDVQDLEEEVLAWRRKHPGQKLRLDRLELDVEEGSIDFVCALLVALDDAKSVTLDLRMDDIASTEDLQCILGYPSLRSLSARNISIATMDIFVSAPQLQLESLELAGLTLEDSASMVRFVKSLNPHSAAPSRLAQTLEKLSIVETDDVDEEYDESGSVIGAVRLAIKDTAAVDALDEVLAANTTLTVVNFVGDYENIPVMPACDDNAKTSRLPAPAAIQNSSLAMARKTAFLSGVRDGSCAAASRFDSNIVQLIFEYSAPFVVRKINV